MLRLYRLKVVSLICVAAIGCGEASSVARPDFNQALNQHLVTITSRNIEAFEKTLTSSDDLQVIFPGGEVLENTQAVVEFHSDWFKDQNWIFEAKVVRVIEGSDQSTALVRYSYQDNAEGEPRWAWLVLVFQLENNQWRLIHDQNTRIEEI